MKYFKLFLAILIICLSTSCFSQREVGPEKLFNEFWQIFKDHYAFFELRGVNWDDQKIKYQNRVTPATTDEELFNVFSEMIDPLDDGHTSISGNGKRFNSASSRPPWFSQRREIQTFIYNKYLQGKSLKTSSGFIVFGLINKHTGYINIRSMEGYNPDEIDEAMKAMKDVEEIIIDVRFNGGGEDNTSLSIAGRFTDIKRFAYSKETFYKGNFNEHLDLFIAPAGVVNTKAKIVVLAGAGSASAAEMFVMAMKTIPNVIIMGENTAGIHSDIYFTKLSNGWNIGLSNQKYMMPDKKVYEKIGVPPTVRIQMNNDILQTEKDILIEQAIHYQFSN